MTPSKSSPRPAFFEAEAKVFGSYSLTPRTLRLRSGEPAWGFRAQETGAGEPVLLLHGLSLGAAHWAPVMARLRSRRCIAIDMPGHGGSEPVDYRGVDLRAWHSRMLCSCLDALDIDSAHLVGHSYGGMFGLWAAHDAPERVRSVVVLGAPAVGLGATPDITLRTLALPLLGPLSLSAPNPLFAYRRILAMSLGREAIEAAPSELVRATYLGTRRPGFARTTSTYLREQFGGARAEPSRYVLSDEELRRIRRPVLVVWGDSDTRYQSVTDGNERTELIPGSRFEVVRGGHEPWLNDPDACGTLISDFIEACATKRLSAQ